MSHVKRRYRLLAVLRAPFDAYDDGDAVLVTIPAVFVAGWLLWSLLGVRFYLSVGGSAVLAAAVVGDALFLNPPTPGEREAAATDASER
jgi:hypothetical protein